MKEKYKIEIASLQSWEIIDCYENSRINKSISILGFLY